VQSDETHVQSDGTHVQTHGAIVQVDRSFVQRATCTPHLPYPPYLPHPTLARDLSRAEAYS